LEINDKNEGTLLTSLPVMMKIAGVKEQAR
jgi:hypothetical protein